MLNGTTSVKELDVLNERFSRSIIEVCCMDEFLTYISGLGHSPRIDKHVEMTVFGNVLVRSQRGIIGVSLKKMITIRLNRHCSVLQHTMTMW